MKVKELLTERFADNLAFPTDQFRKLELEPLKEELLNLGDPVKVSKILSLLGISLDDFKDPARSGAIMDVMEYLKTVSDPEFFVLKAVGTQTVDRIPFMQQYIDLRKKLETKEREMEPLIEKQKEKDEIIFKDNNSLLMSLVSDINDYYSKQGSDVLTDEVNF